MSVVKAVKEFLNNKDYVELLIATNIILLVGTIVFHYLEGWRWLDALHFCVITLTTVGYGDFTPQTDLGKIFNILYILIGLGLILGFIKTVYGHFSNVRANSRKENNHHNK